MTTATHSEDLDIDARARHGDDLHRKNVYHLIPLLFICYLFAHLDRINIGFAKMQMSTDLGFSDTVYGLGAGLFFVSYMLFGVPSNMALDKVGPRRWIAVLMLSLIHISEPTRPY